MLKSSELETLFSISEELKAVLINTNTNAHDIIKWIDDLQDTSDSIESLIVNLNKNSLETSYYDLSEIYLTSSEIVDSSTFSLNKEFEKFHHLSIEFDTAVKHLLHKLTISLNRKIIEEKKDKENSLDYIDLKLSEFIDIVENSEKAIETQKNELIKIINDSSNEFTQRGQSYNQDIIKFITDSKKEIRNQINQLESESMNRIMVSSQSVEKAIEHGKRQLENINNSLDSIGEHELKNIRDSIQKIQTQTLENIRTESSDISSNIQSHLTSTIDSFDKHYNSKISSINKRIDDEVKAFELKRSDMDALLEKVGLAKDADVTITQANRELRSATWLRWTGLFLMCCSIGLLIYFFRYYVGFEIPTGVSLPALKDLGIEFFALRFMTVILVSSPAIYLLKESASHRAKENLYRQRGTQLLTIQGYLADLSPEQRSEVKHKLAENFFKFHNGKADTSNVPDFIKNMNEAIKLAHAIKTPPASAPEKKDQTTTA
ncbi:hypothetical protein ACOSZP_15845 [Vibrio fluvialis]|uniref:hypothetical protein n=1 Tax=Vibrio fluvialis TaxID=676 RepID=UPI003B9DF702